MSPGLLYTRGGDCRRGAKGATGVRRWKGRKKGIGSNDRRGLKFAIIGWLIVTRGNKRDLTIISLHLSGTLLVSFTSCKV